MPQERLGLLSAPLVKNRGKIAQAIDPRHKSPEPRAAADLLREPLTPQNMALCHPDFDQFPANLRGDGRIDKEYLVRIDGRMGASTPRLVIR